MTTLKEKLLKPVNKTPLHLTIVDQIQMKIFSGELPPGTKLPTERVLAAELDVNRGTVREALKKLEILGLVEINHGDGIYTLDYRESGNLELIKNMIYLEGRIPPELMKNILELRRIMVPEMAAIAAAERSDDDIEKLEEVISSEKPVVEKDLQVHKILARAAGNILYMFILNFFNEVFRDFAGDIYFSDKKNAERSLKFHRDIYKAVKEKNARKSREITKEILVFAENRIRENYEKAL